MSNQFIPIERDQPFVIPVIYVTGNTHPDHNSINAFRKRFLGELGDLFTQVLLRAHGLGVLRLGDVSLDGTKIHANASKHKALSWGYANRLEGQLREEVDELLKKAGAAGDQEPVAGMEVGDEVALRQARLRQIGMDAGLHRLQFETAPSAGGMTLPKGKGKPH